jgi:hypothetical protein
MHSPEFDRGYLAGFRDGELAAKEAMSALLDTLEQKYLAIQYAADAQADAATYSAECAVSGQPEDMG